MKKLWSFVLASFVLMLPLSAAAFEYRVPDDAGNVSVGADQSPRNLYLGGGTVDVRANTAGDLVVGGGVLELSGTVEDDLIAGGGTITLTGDVGDTVRIGGGNVRIDSTIDGDLIVGAGTVVITKDAHVRGDLVVGSGMVTVNGPVDGMIRAGVGALTLASTVGGDVVVDGAETVTLDSTAVVNGSLRYSALKPAAIANGAQVKGETTYTELKDPSYGASQFGGNELKRAITAAGFMALLGRIVMVTVLALVLLGLAKPLMEQTIKTAYAEFWPSVGLGLAVLILSPIVLVMLLVTLIGSMVAGAGFLIYSLLVVLAKAIAVAVLGAGLYHWLGSDKGWPLTWQTILVGALGVEVLMFIPLVGWLAAFVFFLMTLGALVMNLRALKRA
ncbi:hypothetical protein HY374_00840 [Candidatus Berkelbacteria bacterium]|nr:hypothetical protein [Candidatus Berkelbacteria bacterium]